MAEVIQDNSEFQVIRDERPSGAVTEQVVWKPGSRGAAIQSRTDAIVAVRQTLRDASQPGVQVVNNITAANTRIKRLERVLAMVLAALLDAADDDGS